MLELGKCFHSLGKQQLLSFIGDAKNNTDTHKTHIADTHMTSRPAQPLHPNMAGQGTADEDPELENRLVPCRLKTSSHGHLRSCTNMGNLVRRGGSAGIAGLVRSAAKRLAVDASEDGDSFEVRLDERVLEVLG